MIIVMFIYDDFEYLKFLNSNNCNTAEQDFMLACFDNSIWEPPANQITTLAHIAIGPSLQQGPCGARGQQGARRVVV